MIWLVQGRAEQVEIEDAELEINPGGMIDVGEIVARGLNDRWRIMSYRDDVTAELKLLKRGGSELAEESVIYDLIDNYRRAEL